MAAVRDHIVDLPSDAVWGNNGGDVTIDETYDFSTGQGRYEVTTEGFLDAFGVVNNIATTVFTDVNSIRPGWMGALVRKDFWDGVNEPKFEWGVDIGDQIVGFDEFGSFESVFGIGAEVATFYYLFDHFEDGILPNETDDRFLYAAPGPNSTFVAFSGNTIVATGNTNLVPEPSTAFLLLGMSVWFLGVVRNRA